jgi:hypothetical protein
MMTEQRDILLKADKVSVSFERLDGGKIRVGTSCWDDPKVILPNQVLEVASVGKQVGLVRVDKPIAYWTSTTRGWLRLGGNFPTLCWLRWCASQKQN